ncbi:hypothetical protein HK102_013848 [Quaeritorhiza haematococci]|nr:hypothetical protein HK102_013848 [Quaeritorhiza haematococci]
MPKKRKHRGPDHPVKKPGRPKKKVRVENQVEPQKGKYKNTHPSLVINRVLDLPSELPNPVTITTAVLLEALDTGVHIESDAEADQDAQPTLQKTTTTTFEAIETFYELVYHLNQIRTNKKKTLVNGKQSVSIPEPPANVKRDGHFKLGLKKDVFPPFTNAGDGGCHRKTGHTRGRDSNKTQKWKEGMVGEVYTPSLVAPETIQTSQQKSQILLASRSDKGTIAWTTTPTASCRVVTAKDGTTLVQHNSRFIKPSIGAAMAHAILLVMDSGTLIGPKASDTRNRHELNKNENIFAVAAGVWKDNLSAPQPTSTEFHYHERLSILYRYKITQKIFGRVGGQFKEYYPTLFQVRIPKAPSI